MRSHDIKHEPLTDMDTFQAGQQKGRHAVTGNGELPGIATSCGGLLHCGICGRRMQGQQSSQRLYCRCRFPSEYALANTVDHPPNVYLNEATVLIPLDGWLTRAFDPGHLESTIEQMYTAQEELSPAPPVEEAKRVIAECDAKLTRYREALEAGTDPKLVARWTDEVQARRAEAVAQSAQSSGERPMAKEEIRAMIKPLGSIRRVLATAEPDAKAEVYQNLGLKLIYQPKRQLVRVEAKLDPHQLGIRFVSRGGLEPPRPHTGTSTSS
ncbi:hypothetical protein GCM10009802_07840 [Streptomyces synnematoformans]|uniref:Recombinase zinc beta ribbon domain-containing protein n=1 Tax=Streptomyces synnematoformans TaxID=415721 RepID=A0ABN2XFF5_9ACTN